MSNRFDAPPSLADLDDLAREALETIPDELRAHAAGVIIRVVEVPDDDTVREMGLDSPFELSGLYSGIPIGEKSVSARNWTFTPRRAAVTRSSIRSRVVRESPRMKV